MRVFLLTFTGVSQVGSYHDVGEVLVVLPELWVRLGVEDVAGLVLDVSVQHARPLGVLPRHQGGQGGQSLGRELRLEAGHGALADQSVQGRGWHSAYQTLRESLSDQQNYFSPGYQGGTEN